MELKVLWRLAFLASVALVAGQGTVPCPKPSIYYTSQSNLSCVKIGADGKKEGEIHHLLHQPAYRNYLYQLRPLTLDVHGQQVFWLDFYRKEIFKSGLDGKNKKVVLSGITGVIEGIAYDWISQHIYMTDSIHDWIIVASVEKHYKKVLVRKTSRPRGIAVDPINRYIFWADSGLSMIERSRLDGSERANVIKTTFAYDVSVDIANKRIYFCDGNRLLVCSCDYFGKALECTDIGLYRSDGHVLFSVAYFATQKRAFVTDLRYRTVRTYNPATKSSIEIVPGRITNFLFHSQVKLFDDSVQPTGSTPCKTDSCSHFCFAKSATEYTCDCPFGMVLAANRQNCTKLKPSLSLYFADAYIGRLYHLTQYDTQLGSHLEAVPAPANSTAFAVAIVYDTASDMVYWSDLSTSKIFRMKSDGSGYQTLVSNVVAGEGIEIDPIGQLLFWTNNDQNLIEVSKLDGSYRTVLARNLDRPRGLVLYPERGLLFVTDWGRYARVEMMHMDGSNRQTIGGFGTNVTLVWPNALALDKIGQKLYYVDAYLDKIVAYDLVTKESKIILIHDDGPSSVSTASIVFRISDRLEHPFGLTLDSNYLYWTDWKTGGVYRVNRYSAEKVELVAGALFRPEDIHSYRLKKKIGYKKEFVFDYPSARCSATCDPQRLKQIKHSECKKSFKAVWNITGCYKCDKEIPGVKGIRCECKDKASCLHRINQISTCPADKPYLHFGVRECQEEIRPGTCPKVQFVHCGNQSLCNSDSDCTNEQKCCDTGCGKLCLTPTVPPPLPCEATPKPCNICVSLPNRKYKCLCPADLVWDGKTCHKKKDPCDGVKLCQNGGKCIVRDDSNSTACECPLRYTGKYCETHITCYPNPCHVNGTCMYNSVNGTHCKCPPYATGAYCATFKKCTTPHCNNGGTCIQTSTSYQCFCSLRYTGRNCEIDKCSNITCRNNASCVVGHDGIPTCECKPNYFGKFCEVPSPCLGNPCSGNGRCDYQLPSLIHKCTCNPGFYGENCSEAIPCYKKCQNGGVCSKTDDTYRCNCPSRYIGQFCERRLNCSRNTCQYGGSCRETPSGYRCICRGLVTGRNCEQPIPCQGVSCGSGACEPYIEGRLWRYRCKCFEGYTGSNCASVIDHCVSNPCLNGGTCQKLVGGYQCLCTSKYGGSRCQSEKCLTSECENGGSCLSQDAAACTCPANFILKTCKLFIGNSIYLLALVPNPGIVISSQDFRKTLSRAFSTYCRIFDACPTRNSVKRKKRESPPAYPTFSADDITISDGYPKQSGDEVQFNFAALAPESATGDDRKALNPSLIQKAVEHQKSFIESELGATISQSSPISGAQGGKKKEEKGGSKAVSAGVSIGVLFVIVPLAAFILYNIYKRKRSKSQMAGPPVAFSNNTFAPESTPEFLDYSQDPRAVPTEAPPEYDAIGYQHQNLQDQKPPLYDSSFQHLQNPLYACAENKLETGGIYENIPAKEQEAVALPPYQEPITVRPVATDEGTGFENPLYAVRNEQEANGGDEKGKIATVGIYTTLENDDDEQAGPLPSKMPLPDSTA